MSDLFICIDCELSDPNAQPTSLNQHGLCPRCGSSSVVPADAFSDLVAKATTRREVVRETPSEQTRLRWEAMRSQRSKDNEPLRGFLRSLIYSKIEEGYAQSAERVLNEQLESTLVQWDGWAYHVYYPWETGLGEITNPAPGYLVIELVQSSKKSTSWNIVIDCFLHEVKKIVPS